MRKLLPNLPWPIMMMIVLGFFLPTSAVFWFVVETAESERLAAQQRLKNAYLAQAQRLAEDWQSEWRSRVSITPADVRSEGERFRDYVNAQISTSLIFLSETAIGGTAISNTTNSNTAISNQIVRGYQYDSPKAIARQNSVFWQQAKQQEFGRKNYDKALALYKKIAQHTTSSSEKSLALIGQMRCFFKLKNVDEALKLLESHFGSGEDIVIDERGNLVDVSAHLLTVSYLTPGEHDDHLNRVVSWLENKMNNYQYPMEGKQRLLVDKVLSKKGIQLNWKYRQAELSAQRIIGGDHGDFLNKIQNTTAQLFYTGVDEYWGARVGESKRIVIFSTMHIQLMFHQYIESLSAIENYNLQLVYALPGTIENHQANEMTIARISMGETMPGWFLVVEATDQDSLFQASKVRQTLYVWIGTGVVILLLVMSVFLVRFISRQITLNSLKNDLISTVSHELKTPLASMRLLLDTLIEQSDEYDSRTQEYLDLILRENHRLTHLVENFLTFSRMERGKQIFDNAWVSPKELVEKSMSSLGEYFKRSNASVSLEVEENLPDINVDTNMMVTVLCNLLENACKYSNADPKVNVRVQRIGHDVCFTVVDNGIGIAKAHHKKVFQRFYRVDQRLSRETEGSGLGLNIVEFIVKNHNGRISLESEIGKGSKFEIYLPVNKD